MRGLLFFLAFISSLPFVFVSPFNGVLLWYVFSLGNFHTLTWGFFSDLYYAYIIAGVTCIAWLFSRTEKKRIPVTPLVALTLLLSLWMTITSWYALAPAEDVWREWSVVHKMLFMCLVGYALTTTRDRVNQLVWVVVLSIGVWGVKGAIWSLLHGGADRLYGPSGTAIGDNNDFGLALIMILPLLFYQWHRAANRHIRGGLMLMGFLVALAVLFTYSRGALVGLCAMGATFWLRSRAKLATGLAILAVCLFAYAFAPPKWFNRMETVESYNQDDSAMTRINMWRVALRIAELHPFEGAGFRVTHWPVIANPLLLGTDLPKLQVPRAEHSIYFQVLSEHGWVGLALFVMIAAYSWSNCAWLIRRTRDHPEFAWANFLGRMGQGTLIGYWAAGAFASQAYLDEYWCVIFIFDAARRLIARETVPSADAVVPTMRLHTPQSGIAKAATADVTAPPGYGSRASSV